MSTSAGAAAAGTGEGGTGCSSKHTSPGVGGAGASERKSRTEAAAPAAEVPVDVRGEQRVEVEFGTFHEFTAVNKNGGKIFEASRKLISAKDAVMFPAMEVSNLASDDSAAAAQRVDFRSRVLAGRVTMVGLFHRQFGYSMLPTWTKPFEKAFPPPWHGGKVADKAVAAPSALSLSLLESWPLRMLKPLLVNTMGRGLSPEQKATFFYRFGPTEEVRKALGMVNRLTLYVLLVDQEEISPSRLTAVNGTPAAAMVDPTAQDWACDGIDLPSFEDEVEDDAELGRVPKRGPPPAGAETSRSAASAALKEACGRTTPSCPVSRLLAKISRPDGAGESKPTRCQTTNGAAALQQKQEQPKAARDARPAAAAAGGTRASAARPAPATATSTSTSTSMSEAAAAAAAAAASTANKGNKKIKKKKKKKAIEKPTKQQGQLLSPVEPPPVPKSQLRPVRPKKIPFTSDRPSVRDDPRRLLGNYGDMFAVDPRSSCSSGEEEEEDEDEEEAEEDDAGAETETDTPGREDGVVGLGDQPAHLPRVRAMPTPPPARRLAPPVRVAAEGAAAAAAAAAAATAGPVADGLHMKQSLDLMAGGAAVTSPAQAAAPATAGVAGADAAAPGSSASSPYAEHTTPPLRHDGFAYPTVSRDTASKRGLHPWVPFLPGAAYPPPAAAPKGFGYPQQHQHQHQHQYPFQHPYQHHHQHHHQQHHHHLHQHHHHQQSFLSGADEALAAAALSGGSPRSSGYSSADMSLDDSLSPASPASRPVPSPAAQAAAAAAAPETAVCYSPTLALSQQQEHQEQQEQQEQQEPLADVCLPDCAPRLAAAVQTETRRRVDRMMGIPAGLDLECQHQEARMEGPPWPILPTPRDYEHRVKDDDTESSNTATNNRVSTTTTITPKKKRKKENTTTSNSKGNDGGSGDARASASGLRDSGGPFPATGEKGGSNIGIDHGGDNFDDGGGGDGGDERLRRPINPSKNHGVSSDTNNNTSNDEVGAAGRTRRSLDSNRGRPAHVGDRPTPPRDAGGKATTTPPSAKRARAAGTSSSRDRGVSSSPASQRSSASRAPQESSHRGRPPTRARSSSEERGGKGGRGRRRRRREDGEMEDRGWVVDRNNSREKRQADNRRVFAEEILDLVERSHGGTVTVKEIRSAIGFKDLGMGMKAAFEKGLIPGVRSWMDRGIVRFERECGGGRAGRQRGDAGEGGGGRGERVDFRVDYYGPSGGGGGGGSGERGRACDARRGRSSRSRSSDSLGRDLSWRSHEASSGSRDGDRRYRGRDSRSRSQSRSSGGGGGGGGSNNIGRMSEDRARPRGDSRSSGPASEEKRKLGDDDGGSGSGSGKKAGSWGKVKEAEGSKPTPPGKTGKSPVSPEMAKSKKAMRRASPDGAARDGFVGADKRKGSGKDDDGGEEEGQLLIQNGLTALLQSVSQACTERKADEHRGEESPAKAKSKTGSAAGEKDEAASTGGDGSGGGCSSSSNGKTKQKKSKKRKITCPAAAAGAAPAASASPSPLAPFVRITKDVAAVVDGGDDAPTKRKPDEVAAGGGGACATASPAAGTASPSEQPDEQASPSANETPSCSPSKKIKTSGSKAAAAPAPAVVAATSAGADEGAVHKAAPDNITPLPPSAPKENGSWRSIFAMQPRSVSMRSGLGMVVAAAEKGSAEEGTNKPTLTAAVVATGTPEPCSNAEKDPSAAATPAAKAGGEGGRSTPPLAAEVDQAARERDTSADPATSTTTAVPPAVQSSGTPVPPPREAVKGQRVRDATKAAGPVACSGEAEVSGSRGGGSSTLGNDRVAVSGSGGGSNKGQKKKNAGSPGATKRTNPGASGKSMNVLVFSNVEKVAGGWWGGGAKKPVSTVAYSAAGKRATAAAPASSPAASPAGGGERGAGGLIKKHSKLVIPVGNKAQGVGEATAALKEARGGEARGGERKRPVSPAVTKLRQRSSKPAAPVAAIFARSDSPQPQPPGEQPAPLSTEHVRRLLSQEGRGVAKRMRTSAENRMLREYLQAKINALMDRTCSFPSNQGPPPLIPDPN
eukprot:g13731.t3